MSQEEEDGLTYAESGVDIDKAEKMVDRIQDRVKETYTDGVVGDLGGFGGLFAPDFEKYEDPVLVAGTDGVGTKLKIAQKMNRHETIGIDLVAMCVNDILAQGAKPLFFLDYLACGKLDVEVNEEIIQGIVEGCKQSRAALIGGETAEMPGFYPAGEYDVAGFAVGIAGHSQIINGASIKEGDLLLGLASSGVHSNGFSLIRYLLDSRDDLSLEDSLDLDSAAGSTTLGAELLTPTRIYVPQVLPLIEDGLLKGISHITGGGMIDNIPRILPQGLEAHIFPPRWPRPTIFNYIQKQGGVAREEMYRTFNMGIGLVLVVAPAQKEIVEQKLKKKQESVFNIGVIKKGSGGVKLA